MKLVKLFISVALLALGGAAISSCRRGSGGDSPVASSGARYQCPMHPTYTSDKPGDCPICGMRLVPMDTSEPAVPPPQDAAGKPLFYRHPMNPEVRSDVPKKDEMGMDYVPVYGDDMPEGSGNPPDRATVSLSSERQQLIGVRTSAVEKKPLHNVILASGRVAYDPDLYNAITEYRQAIESREKVKESPWPDVKERADALVRSAGLRLRQMGLSEDQIQGLASAVGDPTNLLLAEKGEAVWVYAQIYEYEAGQVKRGQTMEVTSSALPGRTYRGRVVAVDSILNPETRTLRIRGEVPNTDGLLKPEMYVDVAISVDLGVRLAVPEEAVLKTGTRSLVFVESAPGKFDPREVTLGGKAVDDYAVISGLSEGERVVTSANFLIDSESRLKAALAGDRP